MKKNKIQSITKWEQPAFDDVFNCCINNLRQYIHVIMQTQNEIIDELNGIKYRSKKDILKHMYLKNGMSYDMLENAYDQACKRIRQLELDNIEYKGRIDRAVNYIDAYTFLVKRENIKNILKGIDNND